MCDLRILCYVCTFTLLSERVCVQNNNTHNNNGNSGVRRLQSLKARVRGGRGAKSVMARRLNSLFAYDIEQQSCIKCLLCAPINALIISPVNAILFTTVNKQAEESASAGRKSKRLAFSLALYASTHCTPRPPRWGAKNLFTHPLCCF